MTAFSMQLKRDRDGSPRALIDAPHELLGTLFEHLGDNAIAVTYLLTTARRVATGAIESFEHEGNSYGVEFANGQAVITRLHSDVPPLRVDLNDFVDALRAWQELILDKAEAPLSAYMKGLGLADRSACEKLYDEALPQLTAQPQLLGVEPDVLLISVVQDYLEWNNEAQARKWLDLLHATQEFEGSPGYLFVLMETCWRLEQADLVEDLLKWFERWVATFDDEGERFDYEHEVGHHYLTFLQHMNRESELTKLYESLEETGGAVSYLAVELIKATGLFSEYAKVSGATGFLQGLAQQLFSASGGAIGSREAPPAMPALSRDGLEAMVRASVYKNAQSTSIYNQLMQIADELEARWQSISIEDSPSPAFYRLVQCQVEDLLATARIYKADDSGATTFDVIPESDGELINSISSMLNLRSPARPGSPNEEPVILWSHRKTAGLRLMLPEMAQRLSKLGYGFIDYFHQDQGTALACYADDLQQEFEQRPRFIFECFSELANVYQQAKRDGAAAMLLSRADKYRNAERGTDDGLDLTSPCFLIYVPLEAEKQGHVLFNVIKQLIGEEIEDPYPMVGYSIPERNRLRPGIEFMCISAEDDDMEMVKRVVHSALQDQKSQLPDGILLEFNGETKPWVPD